jgi:hypothetical protein
LRERLAAFEDAPILTSDYELAARYFNACRARGVSGGSIDLLICAVAHRLRLSVFTTDPDFRRCAAHIPVRIHRPSGAL